MRRELSCRGRTVKPLVVAQSIGSSITILDQANLLYNLCTSLGPMDITPGGTIQTAIFPLRRTAFADAYPKSILKLDMSQAKSTSRLNANSHNMPATVVLQSMGTW